MGKPVPLKLAYLIKYLSISAPPIPISVQFYNVFHPRAATSDSVHCVLEVAARGWNTSVNDLGLPVVLGQ
jgi:hypothetical protein